MWCVEKGNVTIRPSKHDDVVYLSERLRKTDVDEIWAAVHLKPFEALVYSRKGSFLCQTVLHKTQPVAMFGVAPETTGAAVWFLASDDLDKMWLSFLKMSKMCIDRMLDESPLLFNWVDARNERSIRWLKWCGAKIEKPAPFGPDQLPFHFFSIKRSDLCVSH
jgi:hypothetical protein